MLEAKGLKKSFGDQKVLSDITFSTKMGKVYGFLGPNGAGKSTTMNILTGYLAPDAGDVLVESISVIREPQKAKRFIGYLPEHPPLYPDMTVEEYLSYVAALKGVEKSFCREEVARVMRLAELEYVKKRLTRQLSKGYKQRVGLAQAIIGDPKVLILDEPSSGLDPRQIKEMRDLIVHLKDHRVVLLSSHILGEITAVCDHIMVLSNGNLVANDTPEGLLECFNEKVRYRLVLKGNATAAEQSIRALQGLEAFQILREDAEEVHINLTIGKDNKEHSFEEISAACVQAGVTIRELSVVNMSLEEVYLRLTEPAGIMDDEHPEEGIYS